LHRTIKEPRLFVIRSDNSGYELLSEKQLASYFREKEQGHEKVVPNVFLFGNVKRLETEKLVGMETSKAIGIMIC
jgi:hypothetical protein